MNELDAVLPFPGGALRLRSADPRIARRVRERLGSQFDSARSGFPDAPPTGEVEFASAPLPEAAWEDRLRGRLEGTRLVVELSGARGDYDFATGRGRFEIATHIDWFELYVENTLRMILVEAAERAGRYICHTAAVAEPDLSAAYLLFGPSGAGKSTSTELSVARGLRAINDDLVFLGVEEERVWAYGCPFHGRSRIRQFAEGRFPVRAVFRLEQAERNELVPLALPEAVREVTGALVAYRRLERAESQARLRIAESISRKVPVFRLLFRKEPHFWEVIHDGLR